MRPAGPLGPIRKGWLRPLVVLLAVGTAAGIGSIPAASHGQLAVQVSTISPVRIASDPYTVGPAQHATLVEPAIAANDGTVVATFQVGRFNAGGNSMNTGFATS